MAILANTAEAIITPPVGVDLLEPRGVASTGIHDDLFVRALALSDEKVSLVIVTMDLLGLDLELVHRIRQEVLRRSGLPSERLMLTATHTHSAPVTINWDRAAQNHRNRYWEDQLVTTTAECVARALDHPLPATLSIGRTKVQIGFNRRLSTPDGTMMMPNVAGPVAPWVDVLRVDHTDGQPLAVLFSHAAHPVTVHITSTLFTADYPGAAVQTVRRRLGSHVTALFAQGCCGDINVEPLQGGHAEAERVGAILGEAAADAAVSAQPLDAGPFHVVVKESRLPFKPLNSSTVEAILDRAKEGDAALQACGASQSELYNQHQLILWAEQMKASLQSDSPLSGLPFQAQGFAFGKDLVLLGLTHEVFVAYQLYLQRYSPFPRTMVFGYTNGCADYIPTAEAFQLGGYEVQGAPKYYGWPDLEPECEQLVKETALSVLNELWRGYT
jgi:hypothetical protein